MKKNSILAFVLTVAMIFAVNVPAMAAEVTITPAGGTLFLPPTGQMSSVSLGLDVDGTPAEGVTSNISNNTAGVFKSGNSLILDGDLTKAGSVTVNATAGENTASSTMQVSPYILYEDFEDGTVGNNVSTTKIEKLSASAEDKSMFDSSSLALIAEETDGNRYGEGKGVVTAEVNDAAPLDILLNEDFPTSADIITISMKFLRQNDDEADSYPGVSIYDTANNQLVELRFIIPSRFPSLTNIWSKGASDGTKPSGNGESIGSVDNGSWADLRIEMNFATNTFSVYVNDTCVANNYIMYNKYDPTKVISKISIGTRVDDIAVYSGTPYECANSITGTETIYAPPAGTFSRVDGYQVVDADAADIENATITLLDSYEGMQIRDNSLLFSNDVTAGNKTLVATAANGDFLAKGSVEVSPYVYYEDFTDGTIDSGVATSKMEKLSTSIEDKSMFDKSSAATVVEETNGNKYGLGYGDVSPYPAVTIPLGDLTADSSNGKITVTAKVLRSSDDPAATSVGGIGICENGSDNSLIYFAFEAVSTTARVKTRVLQDGTWTTTANRADVCTLQRDEWIDVRLDLDMEAGTYVAYFTDSLGTKEFSAKMRTGLSTSPLGNLYFRVRVDDIAVYTGTPVSIVADEARLTIPATGESSTAITAKYNDGKAVSNLTCTTEAKYITASGNTLSVSSDAGLVPVTVTLSDGFIAGTATFQVDKNFVLVNGSEYTGTSAIVAGSNTVYAIYGASDMPAGNIIYIARYSKNGELISLENFAKSQTTAQVIEATLTDSFGENDFAKVFIWKNGTLVPLGNATEIK